MTLPTTSSFEKLCLRIGTPGESYVLLTVYRPGSAATSPHFFEELAAILESLVVHGCPVIIGGDFNIHVDVTDDRDAIRLNELLSSFDLVQHVSEATHKYGRTLDLVIAASEVGISSVSVDPPCLSDHGLVSCRIPARRLAAQNSTRFVRSWQKVDRPSFFDAIKNSSLANPSTTASAEELFSAYDSVLREIADRFAPLHSIKSRLHPLSPWFDSECRTIRRKCRRLENVYRRTKTLDDRLAWTISVRLKHEAFRKKENMYWTNRIAHESGKPSKLWKSLSKILRRDKDSNCKSAPTTLSAEEFLKFFENKVAGVRASTAGKPPPTTSNPTQSSFVTFRNLSADEVRKIILDSPTKSCALDPIPTFLLKESIEVLLPFITAMCNASLDEGHLPISQRHAIVTPLLKKPSLDAGELKNYRPVSNLTFMSKVVERMVSGQLIEYMNSCDLMPTLQSAYRRHHSTETALLRVISDILGAIDNGKVTLLGLLDLSAAFDTVDHSILLDRLRIAFGMDGVVLDWITSFLKDRTQQVYYLGKLSSIGQLDCSVPQGSALGPLLFLLYTSDLFQEIEKQGFGVHSYADDTQIYVSVPASDAASAVEHFKECVKCIDSWMGSNRLKLNTDKTQVIWIGTRQQLEKIHVSELLIGSDTISTSSKVSDLGVLIDDQLKMSDQISSLCRSCFFQLRQIRSIKRSLTTDSRISLVNAFVSSRLDYCNSLFYGINKGLLTKLQHIQNAAARLISGARKYDHVTPVLKQLHWLPVRQRVSFKIAVLVYKCLHGLARSYLVRDCVPVSTVQGRRQLRSAANLELVVPRTRTKTFGERTFAVSAPLVWNSLPLELRSPDISLLDFRKNLKTFLFATNC